MKLEVRYQITRRVLIIALVGFIMICSASLIYYYNPLELIIGMAIQLTPGSILFKIWQDPPYEIIMSIYIFNITNPEKFMSGEEKLKLSEAGPYAYREIIRHTNATFNEEDGTITFIPERRFVLDMAHSVGDAKFDRIITPNIPFLGIQAYLQHSSFVTNIGFSTLSATLGTQAILNLTVDEFLWGYEDKLVTVANQFLPNWIDFATFGLLERLMSRDNNNTVTIALQPERRESVYDNILTEQERMSPFHIVEMNGSPLLTEWGFEDNGEAMEHCQLLEGNFEGTVFPRHMNKSYNLSLYRKAFCRPIPLEFSTESLTKQGFRAYEYKLSDKMFASPEENPQNKCFCYKGICPGKGLQTIAPCYYNMPIVLSQPHFLNVDPEISNRVIGMNPDPAKHSGVAKIQPELGIPLDESTLRIQVNMDIGKTRFNSKTRPFNDLVLPLFWIDQSVYELPSLVGMLVNLTTEVLPVVQNVLMYLLGLIGLAMVSGSALLALFFTKGSPHRSLSIVSDYSPIPIISIPTPSQYLRSELKKNENRTTT